MNQDINIEYEDIIPFIKENQERFYRFAYRYMKNSEASIDVVQDSIVKALEKIHTLRHKEYLKTWFYRILINECLTNIRRNKKIVFIEQYDDISTTDTNLENKELAAIIFNSIERLSPKYKTIIILRFYEDMTISDIADVLKLNVNTVKSRLYRALELLKVNLENEELTFEDILNNDAIKEPCKLWKNY